MREKGGARTSQLGSGGQDLSLVQMISGAQELKFSSGLRITSLG